MDILLASGNKHKQQELAAILSCGPDGHTLKLPEDAGITDFNPAETGSTFAENALLKARALYKMLNPQSGAAEDPEPGNHGPILADDSGLCVDALGGRPGIYSARYYGKDSWNRDEIFRPGRAPGGGHLNAEKQNRLLLEELDSVETPGAVLRRCRYICAMVLLFSPSRYFLVQETMEGEIVPSAAEIRGMGGFGYDPIVCLPERGCTVAELSAEEKNSLSHRGKAARAIAKLLVR